MAYKATGLIRWVPDFAAIWRCFAEQVVSNTSYPRLGADCYRNARGHSSEALPPMDMAGKLVNATYDLAVAAESDYDTKWTR